MSGSRRYWIPVFVVAMVVSSGCGGPPEGANELANYALDDASGVIDAYVVREDASISSDGGGSLRIDAADPVIVRLFTTGDVDVERASLVYRAMLRTEDLEGTAYLEMWCAFPGQGEFFSRALDVAVSGNTDWVSQETAFILQEGQNPENVRLNLIVDGAGTVWIDDLKLVVVPFPQTDQS